MKPSTWAGISLDVDQIHQNTIFNHKVIFAGGALYFVKSVVSKMGARCEGLALVHVEVNFAI